MKFNSHKLNGFISENEKRLRFDSWASVEKKFLYVNTPKAGCTKIKKMLQQLCGYPVTSEVNPIHKRQQGQFVKSLLDYDEQEQLYLLNSPEVHRFCFIRNPYTRILSAFRSRVIDPKKGSNIQEILIQRRNNGSYSSNQPSFDEFLKFISEQSDSKRDIHWRSQYNIIHFDKIDYNFIGYFESFKEDLERLFMRLGATQDLLDIISVKENPSKESWPGDYLNTIFFDENKVDVVYKSYLNDFQAFGYNRIDIEQN